MRASWVSTAAPFRSSLCTCQHKPFYICLMHRKSSCHCKSTALLFSEFLKMSGVLCLCFVMLLISSIAACALIPVGSTSSIPLSHLGAVHLFDCIYAHLVRGQRSSYQKALVCKYQLEIRWSSPPPLPPYYLSESFTKELGLTTSILQAQG